MRQLNPFAVWNIPTDYKQANVVSLIQRGDIVMSTSDTTKTAGITSVDVLKSEIYNLGVSGGADLASNMIRLTLTNSSTVTATRGSNTNAATVTYQVITRP